MDPLQRLLALEDIRQLKARRIRCMDEKDWDGYAACHTEDCVSYTFQTEGRVDAPLVGAKPIADMLASVLEGKQTVHHVHAPEITLTSDTTAASIWPMEDMLFWQEDGVDHWLHGYGHYRQTYRKVDGQWLIASRALSRIRVDTGTGQRARAGSH